MQKKSKKRDVKWAQLPKIERAYLKAKAVEFDRGVFGIARLRSSESVEFKRKRNRAYQLLKHWCDLKKSNDAQNL